MLSSDWTEWREQQLSSVFSRSQYHGDEDVVMMMMKDVCCLFCVPLLSPIVSTEPHVGRCVVVDWHFLLLIPTRVRRVCQHIYHCTLVINSLPSTLQLYLLSLGWRETVCMSEMLSCLSSCAR